MSETIIFINEKGGVGKTTLALFYQKFAIKELGKKCALISSDKSVLDYSYSAKDTYIKELSELEEEYVEWLENIYDFIIVDYGWKIVDTLKNLFSIFSNINYNIPFKFSPMDFEKTNKTLMFIKNIDKNSIIFGIPNTLTNKELAELQENHYFNVNFNTVLTPINYTKAMQLMLININNIDIYNVLKLHFIKISNKKE